MYKRQTLPPAFWLLAVIATLLFGMSKAGFGGAAGSLGVPLMALAVPAPFAAAVMLPILLVMFTAAALLTQVMSDAATTVLLGPVAISLARTLDLPPTPFVVCTALGAVVAFLTPIGHHGNLLILGPGQYRFGDFLRIGLPLTVAIALVSAWMARWLWLDGPLWPTLQ